MVACEQASHFGCLWATIMAVLLMWLNVIQATLNTRQCWPVVSTTNRMWGGPEL